VNWRAISTLVSITRRPLDSSRTSPLATTPWMRRRSGSVWWDSRVPREAQQAPLCRPAGRLRPQFPASSGWKRRRRWPTGRCGSIRRSGLAKSNDDSSKSVRFSTTSSSPPWTRRRKLTVKSARISTSAKLPGAAVSTAFATSRSRNLD
jgi:hypothetical protein